MQAVRHESQLRSRTAFTCAPRRFTGGEGWSATSAAAARPSVAELEYVLASCWEASSEASSEEGQQHAWSLCVVTCAHRHHVRRVCMRDAPSCEWRVIERGRRSTGEGCHHAPIVRPPTSTRVTNRWVPVRPCAALCNRATAAEHAPEAWQCSAEVGLRASASRPRGGTHRLPIADDVEMNVLSRGRPS